MMRSLATMFRRAGTYLVRLPRLYSIPGAIALVALALLALHFATRSAPAAAVPAGVSHVSVAMVSDLSAQAEPLPLTGTVTSQSRATILAQASGELTSLTRSIGGHVAAGSIIGEFENASQRAAVTQAQGSLESAQAALAKAQNATAVNSDITSGSAATAAQNAEASLDAALATAYASLDDAVHTKADPLFDNPNGLTPELMNSYAIPDTSLVTKIETERLALNGAFTDAMQAANGTDDVDARADAMLKDIDQVGTFLNDLIAALNKGTPNGISASTYSASQTTLAGARTETVGAATSVVTAKSSYDAAAANARTSANSAGTGTQSDVAAAQAAVKTAQGALDAAQAALEKTIIRSPISGTIVSLPVQQGDYVSANATVAVVSNPGALYVDAQVTSQDAKTLAIGGSATVAQDVSGVITFIAPALDPATGKIEVKVGLTDGTQDLTDGEVVSLSLARSHASSPSAGATIPVVAVKIEPTGPVVFTVTASSTLVAHPVTLGAILGDRVAVTAGLTPDLSIVTDARGLADGQPVVVNAPAAASSSAAF